MAWMAERLSGWPSSAIPFLSSPVCYDPSFIHSDGSEIWAAEQDLLLRGVRECSMRTRIAGR